MACRMLLHQNKAVSFVERLLRAGVLCMLAILSGCTQVDVPEMEGEPGETIVLLSVDVGKAVTRAEGYATEPLKSGMVLVCNENGVCEGAYKFSGIQTTFTVREGTKNFYVVGNASTGLANRLQALHWEKDIVAALSDAADFDSSKGAKPTQGLLLSGCTPSVKVEGASKTVAVNLTVALAGVDFRVAKGSADVGNIQVKSIRVNNARSIGYVWDLADKGLTTTQKVSFTPSLTATAINNVVADGTTVSTFYTYPVVLSNNTDFSFTLTVRHAGASGDDVYTIYPNAQNTQGSVDFRRGTFYKVIITFSRDESGNLTVGSYVDNPNDFIFG